MSSMLPNRRRQASLKNLQPLKQYQTSYSPPKLLPTISENREMKKNNAKELTTIISKFNGMNKKESLRYSDQFLRVSIHVLRAFSSVQNNFQQLFGELTAVFKRFTLASDDLQIKQILEKYRVREGYSYRKTCFMMDNELEGIVRVKDEKIQDLQRKLRMITEQYKVAHGKWVSQKKFLQSQVERYKKIANIEYVKSLQDTVQKLKQTISNLQTQNKFINKESQKLILELDEKENTIHELNYEILKQKQHVYDLTKKSQKIQGFFEGLRIRFDELLAKMMAIKDNIEKVEAQNDGLVSERIKLVNRAAVSYQDLTPRPKYKEIFNISVENHINSTSNIFQNLVKKTNMQYKELTTDVILRKKHRKLIETESIRARLSEEIIEAKQEMSKMPQLK